MDRVPGILNRRLGGYQSQPGCFEEEKDLQLPPKIKPWIIQPVA